jgi:hypothetical protein
VCPDTTLVRGLATTVWQRHRRGGDDPPGEQDPVVPCPQSELLYEALKKVEVEVTLQRIPGAGHGGREFGTDKMQAAVLEFFDKHLKPKREAKDKNAP